MVAGTSLRARELQRLAPTSATVMHQKAVTDFFSIRTQKRKYGADGEPARKKTLLLERRDGSVAPVTPVTPVAPEDAPKEPPTRSKVVSKLTFDTVGAPPKLSLGRIEKALSKSSRLDELKARLAGFNAKHDKLKLSNKGAAPVAATSTAPPPAPEAKVLKGFQTIELVVPRSPTKRCPAASPLKRPAPSPVKRPGASPVKSPLKVPAYQRFASLTEETPSLTLPHHYRWLAEVFRAVETASSILHNRKETVTFSRVKTAAQEMLKRNVTEKHLAQIESALPGTYSFTRDRPKGSREYDLVISVSEGVVSPDTLLRRRRAFYRALLEKIKDSHDAFLESLDPPLSIPRDRLVRWHPEFDPERVPDVEPVALPPVPDAEKPTTAKDILSRAKEMFDDPRVRRAALMLKDSSARDTATDVPKFVNPALRNLPPALLKKVKERQAEKALKAMTASDDGDAATLRKLPDLARTLRNLFLSEKKSILPVDSIVPLLENSFDGAASPEELTRHLKMLTEKVPELVTFVTVRKCDYLRLTKTADFTKVIRKLENLADDHVTE